MAEILGKKRGWPSTGLYHGYVYARTPLEPL